MASPFFIVGSGRCGSTWLYSVLREHPALALTNEAKVLDFLHFCVQLAGLSRRETKDLGSTEPVPMRGILDDAYVATFTAVFTDHARRACEDFYRAQFPAKQFSWWGDKLPDPAAAVTARHAWPDARYLVLVRDPRDVLCSWRAHARRPDIARDFPALVDLDAGTHARSWDALYRGLEAHLSAPMTLRYEDLRLDPRRHIGAVLAHLDLPWTTEVEEALGANDTFRHHATAADLDATVERWRRELPAADVAVVEAVCGELMRHYGYRVGGAA